MAKSLYAIEMDFAQAIRQAKELDQIARSLNVLVDSNFRPSLQGIAASWKGDNSKMFCQKGNAVEGKVLKSASDLRSAAATIRQIAQNTYNAERASYEIARMREYRLK